MKSRILAVLMALSAGVAAAAAQESGADADATPWRADGARLVQPTGPNRSKQTSGTLVVDPESGNVSFAARGTTLFAAPLDRIAAVHYEDQWLRQRLLLWSAGPHRYYIAIHYANPDGNEDVRIVRMRGREQAAEAVANLERASRRPVHRSPPFQSIEGIPIRAGVGTRVTVTGVEGPPFKGSIVRLSPSSVTVMSPDGAREFDGASLRRMRLPYDPGRQARVGFIVGAVAGAGVGFLLTGLCGGSSSDCPVLPFVAISAGVAGGVSALGATVMGAVHYPFDSRYDVYHGPAGVPAAHRRGLTIAPQIAQSRRGVFVSVGF